MPKSPKSKGRSLLALLTIAATVGAVTPSRSGVTSVVERTAWLMGTRAHLSVEADERARALGASEAALDAMVAMEELLSTWRDDTELARLNRAPIGSAVTPSPALANLLGSVRAWSLETEGAFEPAVGALIDAWDLRGSGRVPDATALAAALEATGEAGVRIDSASGRTTRLHPDAWIDAGGFGKGAALAAAARVLFDHGIARATLDLGGQLLVIGDEPRTVAVADPVVRDRTFMTLRVADVSVSTSGQSERGIDVDGTRHGHLLDPRTGRPVPDWGSVTVVHPDPLAADVLTTALFVLGPEQGPALADRLGVAALFVARHGETWTARATQAMSPYLADAPSYRHDTPQPR